MVHVKEKYFKTKYRPEGTLHKCLCYLFTILQTHLKKEGNFTHKVNYVDCPGSIHPFHITWKLVMWPWYNLAASHRRSYWASVNTLPWENDWRCVLRDHPIQNDRASRSASSQQCACPFNSSRAGFFGKASHHPGLSRSYSLDLAPCDFWLFPMLKSPTKGRLFVNATVTQYTWSVNSRYFMSKNFHF